VNVRALEAPRRFRVGDVELAHVADVELENDELITFRTQSGSEYDVVRKPWGYYPLPSLNRRLPAKGLRPVLVRARDGRIMLLLCENGHDALLHRYLAEQGLNTLGWLDHDSCAMCGAFRLEGWHRYEEPPAGETHFDLRGRPYRREVMRCESCGHFVSLTDLDLSHLYESDYVDATYGTQLAAAYDRVMALRPDRSDNVLRVARIVEGLGARGRILDVGSGLGVFPARMHEAGWTVTALDPDPRACQHMRERIGVTAIQADFLQTAPESLGAFDLVTFNKVLEHVQDPVGMLARAVDLVGHTGVVYVEVPDGEAASTEGPGREEFFVEHLHVYSPASLALLIQRSGLRVRRMERLREPSTKFTLFAFCERAS
jgi:SAM-dependent methyltransferase